MVDEKHLVGSQSNLSNTQKPKRGVLSELFIWTFKLLISVALSLVYIFIIIKMIDSKWIKFHPIVPSLNDAPDIGEFSLGILILICVITVCLPILFLAFMLVKKLTKKYFGEK